MMIHRNVKVGFIIIAGVLITGLFATNPSFFHNMIPWKSRGSKRKQRLVEGIPGDLVLTGTARFDSKLWKSFSTISIQNEECELEIINNTDHTILVCWVQQDGTLCHFYPIDNGSIRDGSVSNIHFESTYTNHLFVCLKPSQHLPSHISNISPETLICTYRPQKEKAKHILNIKSMKDKALYSFKYIVDITCHYLEEEDIDMIDTSMKQYNTMNIYGFKINYEPNVFDVTPNLLTILTHDLHVVSTLLPEQAKKKLQKDTIIWINTSFICGPTRQPTEETTCTFHPCPNWLSKMKMSIQKAGCIELYNAQAYLNGRELWGPGGLLLHELCHAYHYKCCTGGYDNKMILQEYNRAMSKKIYNCVPVHGPQGSKGPIKAYACTNCMEYFAETSVAYLYNPIYHHTFIQDILQRLSSVMNTSYASSTRRRSWFWRSKSNISGNSNTVSKKNRVQESLDEITTYTYTADSTSAKSSSRRSTRSGSGKYTTVTSPSKPTSMSPPDSPQSTHNNSKNSSTKTDKNKCNTSIKIDHPITSSTSTSTSDNNISSSNSNNNSGSSNSSSSEYNDEYNKWYPHNALLLKSHDPHTYEMLQKIWK